MLGNRGYIVGYPPVSPVAGLFICIVDPQEQTVQRVNLGIHLETVQFDFTYVVIDTEPTWTILGNHVFNIIIEQ